MDFTFKSYFEMIDLLKKNGYTITGYKDQSPEKSVILRHDVDFDLAKAARFAQLENKNIFDVHSVYFILLTSDFYNAMSYTSRMYINEIINCGHEVGLHFDETAYGHELSFDEFLEKVNDEAVQLSRIIGCNVQAVSMHRPSQKTLESNYQFGDLINSYSKEYFKHWKYISDSRMFWREDVDHVICCGNYKKLHILTHPFWYSDFTESTGEKLIAFINNANVKRYETLENNFRDLDEFLKETDIK